MILPQFRTFNLWTSPILFHDYFKANETVIIGPKVLTLDASVICHILFRDSRSSCALLYVLFLLHEELSYLYLINSNPSLQAIWYFQSILGSYDNSPIISGSCQQSPSTFVPLIPVDSLACTTIPTK